MLVLLFGNAVMNVLYQCGQLSQEELSIITLSSCRVVMTLPLVCVKYSNVLYCCPIIIGPLHHVICRAL